MGKIDVIKCLQGTVVTQTMLGELTVWIRVANFLDCVRAKIMKIVPQYDT